MHLVLDDLHPLPDPNHALLRQPKVPGRPLPPPPPLPASCSFHCSSPPSSRPVCRRWAWLCVGSPRGLSHSPCTPCWGFSGFTSRLLNGHLGVASLFRAIGDSAFLSLSLLLTAALSLSLLLDLLISRVFLTSGQFAQSAARFSSTISRAYLFDPLIQQSHWEIRSFSIFLQSYVSRYYISLIYCTLCITCSRDALLTYVTVYPALLARDLHLLPPFMCIHCNHARVLFIVHCTSHVQGFLYSPL